jgi:hypothetical protein
MTNPDFKKRLNSRVIENGKLALTPIEFKISLMSLKNIITLKKRELSRTIKELRNDIAQTKNTNFNTHLSEQQNRLDNVLIQQEYIDCLTTNLSIKSTVEKYNNDIENGNFNVKNIKKCLLFPLSIDDLVLFKDKIKIID